MMEYLASDFFACSAGDLIEKREHRQCANAHRSEREADSKLRLVGESNPCRKDVETSEYNA
jgi:hypothetical protein